MDNPFKLKVRDVYLDNSRACSIEFNEGNLLVFDIVYDCAISDKQLKVDTVDRLIKELSDLRNELLK